MLGGTVADEQGRFEIHNLPLGALSLSIQAVGFEPLGLQNLRLSAERPHLHLPEVMLREAATQLKEVTIKAQADEVNYDLDRKVFNVGDNPAYAGGSAVEVLQNVPAVSVSLAGSGLR